MPTADRAAYRRAYAVTHKEELKEKQRRYRETHREQVREYQRRWIAGRVRPDQVGYSRASHLRRYGVTPEWFRDQLVGQAARCAICGNVMQPGLDTHVDHDHASGKVRGLLCASCNKMLGNARDSQRVLVAGAAYLAAS